MVDSINAKKIMVWMSVELKELEDERVDCILCLPSYKRKFSREDWMKLAKEGIAKKRKSITRKHDRMLEYERMKIQKGNNKESDEKDE